MAKQRVDIPKAVADQVVFDSDLQCCVCQRRGAQIHHIDDDPANNDPDNLVLLCFDHHNDASIRGGMQRQLSPSILRKYRTDWYQRVEKRREVPDAGSTELDRTIFRAALDAQSVLDIRKLALRFGSADWKAAEPLLAELEVYVVPETINARDEVLSCIGGFATRTRLGMPASIAWRVAWLVQECLAIGGFAVPSAPEIDEQRFEMFDKAIHIAISLVHDGDKYLQDLRVVDRGAELLWRVLRYAGVNGLKELVERANSGFDWVSNEGRSSDAQRLLDYYRALANSNSLEMPELPDDLDRKLAQAAVSRPDR